MTTTTSQRPTDNPDGIPTLTGTLSDTLILAHARRGELISENFAESNIKQACYELRSSNTYYVPPDSRRHQESDFIIIKPKQLVVIITMEKLTLPNDILARILTKGQLFSAGIIPVNTYADPGFDGTLGIVMTNISNEYLKIVPGETIAKIEFTRLPMPVARPYAGQHGYGTRIWPIQRDLVLTDQEIANAKRLGRIGDDAAELELSYGTLLGALWRRVVIYERRFVISSLLYMCTSMVLIALSVTETFTSTIWNLTLGVGANLIYTILTFFAGRGIGRSNGTQRAG